MNQNINMENALRVKELINSHSRTGNIAMLNEAHEKGITFTELLEQLDPSEVDSPVDAFERQLIANDIHLSGLKAISMERFINGNAKLLLVELMRREIVRGYNMAQNPTELVATTVPVSGPKIQPIYFRTNDVKESLAKRGPGGGSVYPKVEILYRDKEANIIDRGREFDFEYRVLRNQNVAEFRVILNMIGAQMATDEIDEIWTVLVNGDGTSDGAEDVFDGNAGTFAYSDLIHLSMSFDVPARMTHIIAAADDIEGMIGLSPFQNPVAWRESERFNETGDFRSLQPVNARLVIAPNATTTKVIGMDSRFAIRESVSQPLMIEADKVINQKLEYAVVSKESVYSIMVDDAAKLSDY